MLFPENRMLFPRGAFFTTPGNLSISTVARGKADEPFRLIMLHRYRPLSLNSIDRVFSPSVLLSGCRRNTESKKRLCARFSLPSSLARLYDSTVPFPCQPIFKNFIHIIFENTVDAHISNDSFCAICKSSCLIRMISRYIPDLFANSPPCKI